MAFGFPSSLQHNHEEEEKEGGQKGDATQSEKKKVEAVQGGRVVEASFAKGEGGVRWRE